MPGRKFPFVQVDVFTKRPLEGNQLAVVPDARALSDDEMQLLAKEMNLSETTFILPRDPKIESKEGIRVRIFTVNEELPFAGHPTLGTAWYLRQHASSDEIVLGLNVGKVPVQFEQRDGLLFGEMRQVDPKFGPVLPHAEVANVLGVPVAELDESLPIQMVSTGMYFTIVPFRSLKTLQNLNIGWAQMAPYLAGLPHSGFFYLVSRETVHGNTLHARMIFYNGEDPATGSGGGCCTAWAVKHGVLASDQQGVIEQGLEIKRPSFLHIRATKSGDLVSNVRVGGNVVHVIDGTVTL